MPEWGFEARSGTAAGSGTFGTLRAGSKRPKTAKNGRKRKRVCIKTGEIISAKLRSASSRPTTRTDLREFVENSRHPETPARVTQGPICGLRPGSGESPGSPGSPGSRDEFPRARTEFRICKIRCKKQYVGPSGDLGDCFLTLARQARGRKLTTSKKK